MRELSMVELDLIVGGYDSGGGGDGYVEESFSGDQAQLEAERAAAGVEIEIIVTVPVGGGSIQGKFKRKIS